MAHGLDQFAAHLTQIEKEAVTFQPQQFYEPGTDSLVFFTRDESSYAKRVTKYLTLHLSNRDDSLVGIEVKGLKTIFKAVEDLEMPEEIDIAQPVAVKDEDGQEFDLSVVVRCGLVLRPSEPVSFDQYNEIENATRGIRITKRGLCGA